MIARVFRVMGSSRGSVRAWGPSKLQLYMLEPQMRLPAAGPPKYMLDDIPLPDTERGGEAGRGQFGGLLGGRVVLPGQSRLTSIRRTRPGILMSCSVSSQAS
jgi:hypothetical protein